MPKCKKRLCRSDFLLVPVERIELPTFGLQNRWLKCGEIRDEVQNIVGRRPEIQRDSAVRPQSRSQRTVRWSGEGAANVRR